MKHGSRRAKGQRLQRTVAEMLSIELGLTIEAEKPTLPGTRKNGAVYVPEGEGDLRNRRSGQPGADVALLTPKAKCIVSFAGHPVWFECKNTESWGLDHNFWGGTVPAQVVNAFKQMRGRNLIKSFPVLVLGKNFHPPVAVWYRGPSQDWTKRLTVYATCDDYHFTPFQQMVEFILGLDFA